MLWTTEASGDACYLLQFFITLVTLHAVKIISSCLCVSFYIICTYQGAGKRPRQCCHPKGGRGPEGPEDKGHGHSRARRAREWPKHASPRARRARGRAKPSARFGACQCYYMFFTIQPKIAIFMALFRSLNDGQNA